MMLERLILTSMWLGGIAGFFLFIPKNDRRKAVISSAMFQTIIWFCDMPAFTFHLLSAPVREFPKATDLPITIDYFFYPLLFSIYYVRSRKKLNLHSRFAYFFVWIMTVTLFDNILAKYTDLLEYERLTWYGMWIYIALLFLISQVCCNWFFKDKSLFRLRKEAFNEN